MEYSPREVVSKLQEIKDYLEYFSVQGVNSLIEKYKNTKYDHKDFIDLTKKWIPIATHVICFNDLKGSERRIIKDLLRNIQR